MTVSTISEMEVESHSFIKDSDDGASRRARVKNSIQRIIDDTFQKACNSKRGQDNFTNENTAPSENADDIPISSLCDIMRIRTGLYVESWMEKSRLEDVLDKTDEEWDKVDALALEKSLNTEIQKPSSITPESKLRSIRMESKRKLLDDLNRELSNKRVQVQKSKKELLEEIDRVKVMTKKMERD